MTYPTTGIFLWNSRNQIGFFTISYLVFHAIITQVREQIKRKNATISKSFLLSFSAKSFVIDTSLTKTHRFHSIKAAM